MITEEDIASFLSVIQLFRALGLRKTAIHKPEITIS